MDGDPLQKGLREFRGDAVQRRGWCKCLVNAVREQDIELCAWYIWYGRMVKVEGGDDVNIGRSRTRSINIPSHKEALGWNDCTGGKTKAVLIDWISLV